MKLIKAETDIKPLPKANVFISDYIGGIGTRFSVTPIDEEVNLPNRRVFVPQPRSYIFGVFRGEETWFQVKFEGSGPLVFDLPGDVVRKPKDFGVFMGYNDGFLGATFKPGFYSPRQKILYWYALAKTKPRIPVSKYFVYGAVRDLPVLIDMSDYLPKPSVEIRRPIVIGGGVIIGGKYHIGDMQDG